MLTGRDLTVPAALRSTPSRPAASPALAA